MSYDIDADLKALEAMASNLTPYLYEAELYGTLSRNLPKLTVGGLLLRLYRLEGLEDSLSEDQEVRLKDARLNFEQLRSEWMVHYEGKIQQEIRARLRNFAAFMEEYAANSKQAAGAYPVEATRRTIIHHLVREAKHLDLWEEDFADELGRLDVRLQAALDLDNPRFIWDDALQPIYPIEPFWWLYSTPQEEKS